MDRILKDPETAKRLRDLGFSPRALKHPRRSAEAVRADRGNGAACEGIGIQPE